jgi:hypothetical protein
MMSIKATELRIGNMVLYKPYGNRDGEPITIAGMLGMQAYFSKHSNESGMFHNLQPIPLSIDVLKKCEFTFDDHGRLFYNGLRVSSSFVRWEPVEGWIQLDSPIGTTTIKSVHHLQNWFFALTQQELNINL